MVFHALIKKTFLSGEKKEGGMVTEAEGSSEKGSNQQT